MTKILVLLLTLTLLASGAIAQAQMPQQKPGAQKPAISGGQKKTRRGKLPRMSEVDYLESKLKRLLPKIDSKLSGRESLPYKIHRAKGGLKFVSQLHGGWVLQERYPPSKWRLGTVPPFSLTLDYSPFAKDLMEKWIPKYREYLKNKYGIEDRLSPQQLRQQVWNWLYPREIAGRKAEIKRLEEELAQVLKSIRKTRDRLAIIKSVPKTKPKIPKTKPKKVCKSSDGLLGAMNCVAEEIDESGGYDTKQPK